MRPRSRIQTTGPNNGHQLRDYSKSSNRSESPDLREDGYISLTDMLKAKDGEFFFSNWLRNRNTIEFLGIWERLMNPNFNCAEFDIIKSQAGLNRFRLSAKEWTEKTNAIGIISKAGRYGGTYAHRSESPDLISMIRKDITFGKD